MANGHGGKRPNAGRKRKAEKYERQINAAEKRVADKLPSLIENLLHLANGGYERVKEKLEHTYVRDADGKIVRDEHGDALMQLVVVERTVETADKDRTANIYLIDRILGKPTELQEIEQTVTGEVKITDEATKKAAEKLDKWREEMNEKLIQMQSNSPNASPTLPTS